MEKDLLERLYREYYQAVFLYCLSLCGDQQTAEDLAADAFVKAYLSLPDEIPSFQYWLFRVCRNLWIDSLRKGKKKADIQPDDYLHSIPYIQSPETEYLKSERYRYLWNAIGTLKPMDREIITLHYFSGLSLQEIAVLLGKSGPAVRQRMHRLRKTLKQRMEEQGYEF